MRLDLHAGLRTGSTAANLSLRRGSARRRPIVVRPGTDAPVATGPSPAENHARWTRERIEARGRTKDATRELAAAMDAGETGYRRLRQGLDAYGTRLEAVQVRLVQAPRLARGRF
jgi:hypothetical protein